MYAREQSADEEKQATSLVHPRQGLEMRFNSKYVIIYHDPVGIPLRFPRTGHVTCFLNFIGDRSFLVGRISTPSPRMGLLALPQYLDHGTSSFLHTW